MNSKINFIFKIFGLLFLVYIFMRSSNNPPNGRTGAPNDGLCTDCHDNAGNFTGEIDIDGIPTTIVPNTSYSVTVTSSYTGNNAPARAGFQLVALDENNLNVGSISNVGTDAILTEDNNRSYVEHNPAQGFGNNTEVTWTFNWVSPANGTDGDVIEFYYATVLANGANGNSNDNVFNTSYQTTISNTNKPIADAGADAFITCTSSSAVLLGIGSSQGSNYTYLWTGPGNIQSETTLAPVIDAPGIYTLTVTDTNNGCTASDQVEVSSDTVIPNVNVSQGPVSYDCDSGVYSFILIASSTDPSVTFFWTGPNGYTSSGNIVSVNDAGTYMVNAGAANGCENNANIEVEMLVAPNPPTITVNTPNPVLDCNNTTTVVSVDSDPNLAYEWYDPNGIIIGSTNEITVDICAPYTVVVTDVSTGCTASETISVSCNSVPPIANAGEDVEITISSCTNIPSISLDGTQSTTVTGTTYLWTTTNGNILGGETTLTPSINQSGVYTLTVLDASGCSASDAVNVNLITDNNVTLPIVEIEQSGFLNCNGLTAVTFEVLMPGNFSFMWTDANNVTISTANTIDVNQAGNYTLVVSDPSTGCSATQNLTVEEHFLIIANPAATILCAGDTPTLTADISGTHPPYDFIWDEDNNELAVLDALGCEERFILDAPIDPAPLSTSATIMDESEPGAEDGSIELIVSGGTPPYSFEWDIMNPPTDGLSAGDYTITVTDANGCVHINTFTVGLLTSINDPILYNQIQLFPNPSDGLLSLKMDLVQQENIIIKVYDFSGQLVDSQPIKASTNGLYKMDWTGLSDGIYLVKINVGTDIVSKKIMIHK